ncbi:MAG: SCE4755 family polysaccharide monooxygenase-like protein [Bdellovibrionota bacterium]
MKAITVKDTILSLVLGLISIQLIFLHVDAHAHNRLLPTGTLLPRNLLANKVGPCGSPRGATVTYLIAGQQLNVQFEEFIDHPGYYRIAFSPSGDLGFDQNVLADQIPDIQGGTLPRPYSKIVTVPNTPCTNCTIQVIQYMTEVNPPSLYFSCADVVILPQGSVLPPINPGPAPAPSGTPPSPTPGASPAPGSSPKSVECIP